MIKSSAAVPYASDAAYGDVSSAGDALFQTLNEAIWQHENNQQYSNCDDVGHKIEGFVDALHALPGGREELHRRATLVETSSGADSEYAKFRERALASYTDTPSKLTNSKLALSKLRNSNSTPIFLSQVTEVRQQIDRILEDEILDLSTAARTSFDSWRIACREIQREAGQLKVDGAWYLFHIHHAGEDDSSVTAKGVNVLMQLELGGASLGPIKMAEESLVAWASKTEEESGEPKPKKKRSDRPATINERMLGVLAKNPESSGWKSPEWAAYLDCSKSSVVETAAWKHLRNARLHERAIRKKDRRRKPKASDMRRD